MSDFSLEQSVLNLNGHVVTGWSDDTDGLSLPNMDIANVVRGASGKMVAVSTGDKGGPLTIKLLPNSASVPFFMNLVTAQKNGASITYTGYYRDPINNINVALVKGTMTNAPQGPTLGKGTAANFEFTIEFESTVADYLAVNFS